MAQAQHDIQGGDLVHISVDSATIEGDLSLQENSKGVVLFAHGAGSSRHSHRNHFVAEKLHQGSLATLLIDLLTPKEKEINQRTRKLRFDIKRLAARVVAATDWLREYQKTKNLNIGFFGSSTGAAGALIAAAERPGVVEAVVSRGGRVDMAQPSLPDVKASVLFVVGGKDYQVIEWNRHALSQLETEKQLQVIPNAGHLFEESGALDQVARLTRKWFESHLGRS